MGRQGFPHDALSHDEELKELLRPHWRVLVLPGLWTVVYLALILTVWITLGSEFWGRLLLGVVGIVGLVLWILVALRPFLRWRSTQFAFTARRVLVRTGVMSLDLSEIPLGRVNDVKVRKSLVDRVFGSGALIMGEYPPLENIPHVVAAFKLVNELIERKGHTKGVDAQKLEDRINQAPADPPVPGPRATELGAVAPAASDEAPPAGEPAR